MTSIKRIVAMVAVFGAVVIGGSPARADSTVTCSVTQVAWVDSTVQIQCGGNWYYAFASSATCPTTSADGLKAYLSLAQAARVNVKQLTLQYNGLCSGGPALTRVDLN